MAGITRHLIYRIIKNKVTRKIQYAIIKLKKEQYDQQIKKLSNKNHTLWKNVNRLKKKTNRIEYLTDSSNQKITKDIEIAELLANN